MFIAILIVITAIALFLIFRDDHDRSYHDEGYAKDPKKMNGGAKGSSGHTGAQAPRTASQPAPKPKTKPIWDPVPKPAAPASPAKKSIPSLFLDTLEYDEDLAESSEFFSVNGLRYYCTDRDLGIIFGTVRAEPSNPHDPRAQVVKLHDGRTIGYIPRNELDEYEDFNEDDAVCPFVGEITKDSKGWFQAEILVVIPASQDYVREEFEGYL